MSNNGDMPGMTPGGSIPESNSMNMSSTDIMMHTSFYWGNEAIILFSGWPKDSTGMYVLAFLFVLILAIAIEVLSAGCPPNRHSTNPFVGAFIHASFYAIRMALAYLVMLAVMSFNIGIFIAAVAGHAIGSFIVKARAIAISNKTSSVGPKV